ncbi:MAG: 4-hydroxy-3-methylbut-2-enyl diphosphate reductase [Syntrophobacterales bacterium]|jgi:4-hydroxy-3-methylbut-2-enyl diphosphate reductase|nr:4-hydroxy-3-methylbut-2-enyl diphosphate reductase [Syntrophobacterales bacterium]
MGVKLAQTAGFCMGVRRAVDMVLDMAQKKRHHKIYTYGPLIHNPQTVALLEKRGITPINSLDEINHGSDAIFVIRAHGISPQERKAIQDKGVSIVDATCPKVTHVQSIIAKHSVQGYTTVIIGDKEHPEVNGLLGYAGQKGIVLSCAADVDNLSAGERLCVVAQTTQSMKEYQYIRAKIYEKHPDAVFFNTICDSTEKRQHEVEDLSRDADAMVIIGGRNSANTCRLVDLSRQGGKSAFHIETADELADISLLPYKNLGVSAGASTPNWIINRVVNTLTERQGQKKPFSPLLKGWLWTIKTGVYSLFGAACLSYTGMLLQGLPIALINVAIMVLYVFAMHTLNRFINTRGKTVWGSFREDIYQKYQPLYVSLAIFSLFFSLYLAFMQGTYPFLLLLVISALGIIYNLPFLPFRGRALRLKELPGSKNVFVALAWASVGAVLPFLTNPFSHPIPLVITFLFIAGIVFFRSSMVDLLDIQSDRLIGRETIPVVIGEGHTKKLLILTILAVELILLFSYFTQWISSLALVLLTGLFYILMWFNLYDKKSRFSEMVLEGLLETSYIVIGAVSLFWHIFT